MKMFKIYLVGEPCSPRDPSSTGHSLLFYPLCITDWTSHPCWSRSLALHSTADTLVTSSRPVMQIVTTTIQSQYRQETSLKPVELRGGQCEICLFLQGSWTSPVYPINLWNVYMELELSSWEFIFLIIPLDCSLNSTSHLIKNKNFPWQKSQVIVLVDRHYGCRVTKSDWTPTLWAACLLGPT